MSLYFPRSKTSPSKLMPSLKVSASIFSLVMASGLAQSAAAQTIIADGANMPVTSMADGEMISVATGVTSTTNGTANVTIANNNVTLDNAGTLATTGVTNTVQVNTDVNGATINNSETGIISADSRAINVDGDNVVINNAGQILGTDDQRNGTIYGNRTSNGLVINNLATGVIDAGAGNQGAGIAIEVGGGGNPITGSITNAGIIQGRGQAAPTGGTAGDGLRFFGPGLAPVYQYNGDITNSGTIASESAVGTTAGIRFANRINFGGTLTNEAGGTISGVNNGLYFGEADHTGGQVNNAGVISSDSRALNIDGSGLTVNNTGSILGTGNQRNGTVYADSTAQTFTLNNDGVIDAGEGNEGAGFSAELTAAGNDFDIINSGTIQGRGQASAGATTAGDGLRFERTRVGGMLDGSTSGLFTGTITNSGTIDSESAQGTAAGIRFVNGVSFNGTIDNSGTISGVQNGLYFGNATPAGGGDFTGAVVNNSGVISSASRALNIDGLGLTVNNSGSILGTGDQRNGTVYADATANDYTFNNLAGGLVDAGAGNNGSGVSLQSGNVDGETVSFTFNNAGIINGRGTTQTPAGLRIFQGAADVTVNADIVNSGTISSESEAAILIQGVNLTGTITNSGTLSGTSVLDASTATGGVTFNQIGGAFNANFIGSNFDDTLSISGPNFGLNADILGGVETSIDSASTVNISGDRTIEGNLTSNGELAFNLSADSLNVDGDAVFGPNSVVTISTDTNINDVTLNSPITVISQTGTFTNNGLSVNVIDDDFLVDYTVELGSVIVTATAADLSNVSSDNNVSGLASSIGTAFAAGQLADGLANTFNQSSSAAAFEDTVISLLPTLNEGVSREIWETHSQTALYVSDRLTNEAPGGAWVQGSTRSADLDAESVSIEGYEADTTAFTFGYDRQVNEALRLGVSFTFADSDIDEDVNAGESNDLNTNQIAAYAGYKAGEITVSGQVGYVFGDGDTTRTTELGTITGDYDVSGFIAQTTAAYNLGVIKPQAGLRYGSISQDDFVENGGLNLNVDVDSVDYFEGLAGVVIAPELEGFGGWVVKPNLRASYVYDFISDSRDLSINLPGAAAQVLSSGDAAGSRFEIGAGLDLVNLSGLAIGVAYEGDFASGYSSNAGLIRARFGF